VSCEWVRDAFAGNSQLVTRNYSATAGEVEAQMAPEGGGGNLPQSGGAKENRP